MKKKLIALALVVCLAAVAIGGATLAYFTDTDNKKNEFTTGSVDITLNETFVQNSQLIPGQDITKEVSISVASTSLESYVWYTYTVPAVLDDEENPVIEITLANASDWTVTKTGTTKDKNGVVCNVYTALYNESVGAGEKTSIGMSKVTMSTAVDYDNAKKVYTINGNPIDYDFTNGVEIDVTAYGIQAATFNSASEAYTAYNG